MGSSILQLCQDACDDPAMNIDRPSTLFPADDNGDSSARKLLRSLTRCLNGLAMTYDWQALRREMVFETITHESQPGSVPSDFRRFVPDTFWNRSQRWRLNGPLSPSDWQTSKAWRQGSMVPNFCIRDDAVQLYPVPPVGVVCSYEYITTAIGYAASTVAFTANTSVNNRILGVADTTGLVVGMTVTGPGVVPGSVIVSIATNATVTITTPPGATQTAQSFVAKTPRTRFAANTDTTVWPDELVIRGIVLEHRKGERMDYAQDQQDFELAKADTLKQDGGRRRINMRGGAGSSADDRLAAIRSGAVVVDSQQWGGASW